MKRDLAEALRVLALAVEAIEVIHHDLLSIAKGRRSEADYEYLANDLEALFIYFNKLNALIGA